MEELTGKFFYVYRSCSILQINLSKRKGSASNGQGADSFSPSLPGNRYLKLGSKSDLHAEISGSFVWYNALAPRSEVLRLILSVYGNLVLWVYNWNRQKPLLSCPRLFFILSHLKTLKHQELRKAPHWLAEETVDDNRNKSFGINGHKCDEFNWN